MLLSFTALDEKARWREFCCELIGLEEAFDFLNLIANEGHTIVQAFIHEDSTCTELPGEAFDGKPISASIRKLEKQWKQALKSPPLKKPRRPANDSALLRQELTRQRIKLCDTKITIFETSIHHFEILRQQTEDLQLSPFRKDKLIRHYEQSIVNYQHLIARALTDRYALETKLK
ncbi:hypothetical protein IC229_05275 [Spirosoma sp. BT702]|uniref:Uncharacterized protein n=1 Tax=Spirosoma profusum TaxID=2771354 RepID=A0A926XUU8_9BACT|nr:hypothetical protein [Spirosoma profusum]MBD2700036.1 hypothetical protein [Spirosoma profusum]